METRELATAPIRADGPAKVAGHALYTADLTLPGTAHAALVPAGVPHARIVEIDTSRAVALSGVLAVLTRHDVADVRYGAAVKDRPLLARDVVRFDGETVAAVAAVTEEVAREACRLVRVEYEALAPLLDAEAALAGGVLLHPAWAEYECLPGVVRQGNDCGHVTIVKGDAERGLAEAHVVLEERYRADMSHPVPIEPHAVVAHWSGDRLTVWSTTQAPFGARAGLARTLGLAESSIRVVVPHLGGGFGGKCDFHFEGVVAALARKAGRPVRLVLTRREEFTATDMARHPMTIELATGVRRDGTITARRARLVLDTGAYASHGPSITEVATMMAAGPYRIPHLEIEGHTVYTSKTPAGSTRAPSGPQVCWAVEQHTDALAERLGVSPYEFRLLNLVEDGDEGPTGQRLEAVGAKACLRRAAELVRWDGTRADDEGIGLACGWWLSLPAPSGAYVRLEGDGTATIVTGAQENGSGAVAGLALLAADELGLQPGAVAVHAQDTDAGPWDLGSCGSQTTFNNGRAVLAAAAEVRERLLELAAEELEAAPADLELADGVVRARDAPSRAVSVANLAGRARDRGVLILGKGAPPPPPLPESFGGACTGRAVFPAFAAPSFFCHAARVKVDRETGVVRTTEVAAVHDFGRVLNPAGATGQVEGGVVHSLGMAFTERTVFDGSRQANPHLLDYKLPTSADAPRIHVDFVETSPSSAGPHGAKGAGEPPVVATAGAAANALAAVLGARVHSLPMTPYRVWTTMRSARPAPG